jgi:peptidyl-prolyl cis-trans isomerase A (cyclophilin A)
MNPTGRAVFAPVPGRAPLVRLETALGDIDLELRVDAAPVTAAAFLAIVDSGSYAGAAFYRVVRPDNQPASKEKIEVIQGGLERSGLPMAAPCIAHETTEATGLRHLDGTLSMARDEPGSASSEIFICVGDQPSLDFGGMRNPDGQGFAAFGRVVAGMDVVRLIQAQRDEGQYLIQPVAIRGARRL